MARTFLPEPDTGYYNQLNFVKKIYQLKKLIFNSPTNHRLLFLFKNNLLTGKTLPVFELAHIRFGILFCLVAHLL